jgi:predicted regulator of Ras-like GTPase activity (Roadblock/LC7/MglB family)
MFKDALRDIVDRTDGGLAGIVMDSSGIPVETYSREGSPLDINAIGVEFGTLLGSIKRAAEMLEAGGAKEVAITTDKMIAVIRMLNESYFLAIAMTPDANMGKGRFLMRTAAPRLAAELS